MDANEPTHHKWPIVRNWRETPADDPQYDQMTPEDDGVYPDA